MDKFRNGMNEALKLKLTDAPTRSWRHAITGLGLAPAQELFWLHESIYRVLSILLIVHTTPPLHRYSPLSTDPARTVMELSQRWSAIASLKAVGVRVGKLANADNVIKAVDEVFVDVDMNKLPVIY